MTWMKFKRDAATCVLLAFLPTLGLAQEQEESKIDQLEKKVVGLESQVAELRSQQAQGQEEVDETFDEIDEQMLGISKGMSAVRPGKRKFLITGYAAGGFTNKQGEDSTFSGDFFPIFLWKATENIFLEAETEFELQDGDTNVALEYAQMSYVLNDSTIFGFGKFLNPGNPFAERLHPGWINKLPDAPLAVGAMRLMPFTQLGAQVHGGIPLGSQKLSYALYVSNGQSLQEGSMNFGKLDDHNYSDLNNSKAVGGRVGYFPVPELEVGYALEFSQATASGSDVAKADVTIQSVDLNHTASMANGTFDLRAQWVFSNVDDVTFDPNGTDFGPVSLNNNRNGGYVQAAFRPSEAKGEVVKKFEGVVRYDEISLPSGAPEGGDQSSVTVGLNYWASASTVFKVAYRIADNEGPGQDADTLLFQWAIGF